MFFNKYKKLFQEADWERQQLQTEMAELKLRLATAEAENTNLESLNTDLRQKYAGIINLDTVLQQREADILSAEQRFKELNEKYRTALEVFNNLSQKIDLYNDSLSISEYGLYQPQYSFELPEQYRLEL